MSDEELRLTAKADAWCDCVSDFGPLTGCTNCSGTGRDPQKWLAWKLRNCRLGASSGTVGAEYD